MSAEGMANFPTVEGCSALFRQRKFSSLFYSSGREGGSERQGCHSQQWLGWGLRCVLKKPLHSPGYRASPLAGRDPGRSWDTAGPALCAAWGKVLRAPSSCFPGQKPCRYPCFPLYISLSSKPTHLSPFDELCQASRVRKFLGVRFNKT